MKNLSTDTAEFSSIKAGDSNGLHLQDDGGNGIFIKAGGDVGIGTTNPGVKLEIEENGGLSAIDLHRDFVNDITANTNAPQLRFLLSDDTESKQAICSFSPQGTVGTGGKFGGNFRLSVADNSGTLQNRLTINEDGEVGIGTTSPDYDLDVRGWVNAQADALSTNAVINLAASNNSGYGAISRITSTSESDSHSASSLTFSTRNSDNSINERMRINSIGNVGIGTTNPDAKLHIFGTNSSLKFTRDVGDRSAEMVYDGSKFLIKTPAGDRLSITDASSNELLTVNPNDGHVGIGTANPLDILHVSPQGVVNSNFRVAGGSGLIHLKAIDDTSTANENLALGPAGNTIYIKKDGKVGIGTTNPAQKLDVNGNIAVQGTTVHTSDDRVKHNEQPIVGALETLGKITPKKYIKTAEMYDADHNFELDAGGNPVDENGESVEHRIEAGVIAQQVLEVPELAFMVSPEGVDEDGNVTSPHGLNYNSLFTYTIAAIQEQQQIIEDLKSRIETIEQ